jgi:hypothetical protein
MRLDGRLARIEMSLRASAGTGLETPQERAPERRRRELCPDCGGLGIDEVRRAVTVLPTRFVVGQTGHAAEEDVILDLERSEAVCRECEGPTFGSALFQSLQPCRLCGPSADYARVLGTTIRQLGRYLGAIGMLQQRCPRCKTMPPWEPAGRRNQG